jgi:hypothetical protein
MEPSEVQDSQVPQYIGNPLPQESVPKNRPPYLWIWAVFLIVCFIGALFMFNDENPVADMLGRNSPDPDELQSFQQAYGIQGPLEINNRFIFVRRCALPIYMQPCPMGMDQQIAVSDIKGQNLTVIKNLMNRGAYMNVYAPSPRGSYYIVNGPTSSNSKITTEVFDMQDHALLSLDPRLSFEMSRWSPDEKYLAIPSAHQYVQSIVVYDMEKRQKLFEYILNPSKVTEVGQPYATPPRIRWSDSGDILYTEDDTSLVQIQPGTTPVVSVLTKSIPCTGLAIQGNQFYCSTSREKLLKKADSKEESYHPTIVIRYDLQGNTLVGPTQIVKNIGIDGDYGSGITLLDSRYLLVTPSFGGDTIVDIESGRIGETASYNLRGERDYIDDIPLFSAMDNQVTFTPVVYLGK